MSSSKLVWDMHCWADIYRQLCDTNDSLNSDPQPQLHGKIHGCICYQTWKWKWNLRFYMYMYTAYVHVHVYIIICTALFASICIQSHAQDNTTYACMHTHMAGHGEFDWPIREDYSCLCDVFDGELRLSPRPRHSTNSSRQVVTLQRLHWKTVRTKINYYCTCTCMHHNYDNQSRDEQYSAKGS